MNFSEDVKYYLKILYYEYFPQHHAKKNEESGEAQRERYALMRSRCSEVPHKMSFREDVAARYSRKIVYFSAVLAPQHTRVSRQKKNETFSLLSSLSHLFELLLLRSRFPSRLFPRGVRVGGCVFLFVRRTVCATPHNEVSHPFGSASERHHHHTAKGKKKSKTLKTNKTI